MFNFNKKFWLTAFTLTGTMIGAGILGLPYVFAQSGYLIGFFWLLFLGVIIIYVKLCLGEVTLRTKGVHQLPGYAKIYLGKTGRTIMFLSTIIGIYSALVAYLIGEGESLSKFFIENLNYAIYFAFLFWLIMTLILREGLRGLKKVESYGVLAIIIIVLGIFIWFFPSINSSNFSEINKSSFFMPLGVTLFALLGFSCIPELRREIKGSERLLRKAIITGALISVFLYFIFTLTFVGVFGKNVGEIATLSSGRIIALLGVFTMLTSYFVLSFALKDIFIFDIKISKKKSFILVSIIPLLIYVIVTLFHVASFVSVLGIGGVISGGLTGIMILITSMNAKTKGKLKPNYEMPLNWFIVGILSLLFMLAVFIELVIF